MSRSVRPLPDGPPRPAGICGRPRLTLEEACPENDAGVAVSAVVMRWDRSCSALSGARDGGGVLALPAIAPPTTTAATTATITATDARRERRNRLTHQL